jgi:hypothetical protein
MLLILTDAARVVRSKQNIRLGLTRYAFTLTHSTSKNNAASAMESIDARTVRSPLTNSVLSPIPYDESAKVERYGLSIRGAAT